MADPLSITASLLAITTAAVQSGKSLCEVVRRYKGRDKTLRRLQDELEDLIKVLDSLTKVTNAEESVLELLQRPVERCKQVCNDFELSMVGFNGKSKTSFRDWTRMEFMRGDINEFIDTIAGYKSTISVGLGTITMQTSQVSHSVLLEYNEMIQDTAYNLELQLRRIDEKVTQLTLEHVDTQGISIDLEDEREVTKQCLRVCEDARSHLESLSSRASSLLNEGTPSAARERPFEAQFRTSQALEDSRESFAQTIGHISRRLESLVQNKSLDSQDERLKLQSDIEISKQCLDVCRVASEVSHQKIYRIGEVIADGQSDQVVVTTLADLFDIGRAQSTDNSAQLIGSMTEDSLRDLTEQRYRSRFGVVSNDPNPAKVGTISSRSAAVMAKSEQLDAPRSEDHARSSAPRTRPSRAACNETRKRLTDDAMAEGNNAE